MPQIARILPEPQIELSFPLMRALQMRRSVRKWSHESVTDQELSNLLWAACGITKTATNKSKSKRTVPSASNAQVIKIYVALKNGLFLYDETCHRLQKIFSRDIRKHIGTQKMMRSAPLGLIYVADYSKMYGYLAKDENRKWFVSGTETGFISQNVYLFCAAAKLSTVILGLVDRDKLHACMRLPEHEKVVYTQAIGKSLPDKN